MPESLLILFAFGCLSGVTTVLFGFGGGFVTVPVIAAVAGGADPLHVAVATSAVVMAVNSAGATFAGLRSGRVRREYLWPLTGFVGLGAVLGAFAATRAPDGLLRALFAAYLAVTVLDSLLRRGFLRPPEQLGPLGRVTVTAGGVGIGAVASFLGVGGSVMTVPLLRRKGLPMTAAVALANPLSLPVALVATAVYASAGPGPAGYVDPAAALALLAGSLPTIALVRRFAGRLPDRVHVVAYLGLLVVALVAVLA
ncbi:sulfite exporter TauE/SafE family protein [Amycolatopsis sp. PS_44_ISF1]|uniref:sulfite exporter TauE/SafE family protein n=1 Tax=Amycolatopsis sp. PS_44_ISF1 TaxID=2974917 RepID=UPI0028DEC864|nr:sulfite exporter TauE/SafE family protein [Amycolatopsis sp. PS_44_ISF1]MDT8912553.1 sulfite exporter TauE/SafE family protein [Amycolatopsis sp. PS_44_ISF1]